MHLNRNDVARLTREWPGKSLPDIHPALWHMLDVGAVARVLLEKMPLLGPAGDQALAALIALHDLGKVSASFRAMLQDGRPQRYRHWEHSGDHLWRLDPLLADHFGGTEATRKVLVEAIVGHHGGPRAGLAPDKLSQQRAEIGAKACMDAHQILALTLGLFPQATLDGLDLPAARALSWHLNGLTVQADWIGSNPDWFAPASPELTLEQYWKRAQDQARRAISAAGLFGAEPLRRSSAPLLGDYAPRPLQQAALSNSLPDGPTLMILEDSTGAGKTEGALILAHRMMQASKGAGLFFALPTMATANAMLPRLESAAEHLFDDRPTLALSHGRAHLSEAFREICARDGSNTEDGPHCGRWLGDDRRRVLMADMGVGTVDQALLGVLPTRFNGLRLRALSQRILIVDEAHDYDPYMQAQLERLLQMQARLGGSAIVMTATLPGVKKQAFQAAFQRGLKPKLSPWGGRSSAIPSGAVAPYPALTTIANAVQVTAVEPARSRNVGVERIATMGEAVGRIKVAQAQGAACIWIRNAVDDAIAAVDALQDAGVEADLLHARFALCDRLAKEAMLRDRFGPAATQARRAGQVLVATQVVEQSLDLDFDLMISDLAPIGAMIQRAGRLWRHMEVRPALARPIGGPCLQVLSPDPDDVPDVRWLHRVLDRGAYTYQLPDSWRAAKALFQAGEISEPAGLRPLIEAAEGADPLPLPEVLAKAEIEKEGQGRAERGIARNAVIDTHDGFQQKAMAKVWDEEVFPTRLGVPQVTLALAVQGPDGLSPLAGAVQDGWALSEVSISVVKFDALTDFPDQSLPSIAAVKSNWSEARGKHTYLAPLSADGKICEGLRYDRELGMIFGG
ncbi:CRISPR-associated helicase Cas3' [Shimia sp. R9_3]|uniref:CRISPR-associated helicase Cas3' n=1 Tax=Shimia sp. R9_3 TaxID=2821113 RepID=UPI001ADD4B42|nr:CRISPR-associated helicase Cas3' [Shimia sp. R9_3]MBO9401313.1 CRISPR-associated helicase Cas3' [Shimia sp. R9_3]